jgi:integrase
MPKLKPTATPSYRKHKPTGQAVVTLNGRDHYLGRYGTAASQVEYDRVVKEWLAAGRQLPQNNHERTINELILAYWWHVQTYYVKDGKPTNEVDTIRQALRPLKALYGNTPAAGFGPLALAAVRQKMIELDWCRTHLNKQLSRIKGLFKWGESQELIPRNSCHWLETVTGLKKDRSEARESEPVRPVPEAYVDAVLPHVSPQVAAMISLQRLTAMRPGEVTAIRACDLETSGRVWVYRPESHKTEHHGKTREIYLGPQAQEVLKQWLKPNTQTYLFSPAEAEGMRSVRRRRCRKTPLWPSHVKARSHKRKRRQRAPGDRYDVAAYRRAVVRGCLKAKVPQWHPHQLRHNAATHLRKEHGIELARIILGHATAFTTEIYAEVDKAAAMEVVGQVG